MATVVTLDGTTLEGGGQLLRVALSLSALYSIPIYVDQIRGNRAKKNSQPGVAGGLKSAHLAAVKWLALATKADTKGAEVGSSTLSFRPTRRIEETDLSDHEGPWKQVYEKGKLIRYESIIHMSTPGSITLILQAILPYVLFLRSPVPLRLMIEGGTNVSKSPSVEYTSHVFLPILSSKLWLPTTAVEISKRGWSAGRTDPGLVSFEISPWTQKPQLRGFDITTRGELESVLAYVIAPAEPDRQQIHQEIIKQVTSKFPNASIEFVLDEISSNRQRCYLLLVGETSSKSRLGYDCLDERKAFKGGKQTNKTTQDQNKRLVSRVLKGLKEELSAGGAVDEFLEDQLVVFQAIAEGQTKVKLPSSQEATLHTQTARWVAEQMIGVKFGRDGSCNGKGLGGRET